MTVTDTLPPAVTPASTPAVGSKNLLDHLTRDRELPEGYDGWLIRTVRPDFRSSHGYRYPFIGKVAKAPGPILDHTGECPRAVGDGLCAALNWYGMASGSVPAGGTLLLVAYRRKDVLGESAEKLRLRKFLIVDILDGADILRQGAEYADLHSANLRSADLHSANLRSADLYSANLRYANLSYANLSSADLRSANLSYANLSSADLRSANLRSADLNSADLSSADLRSADLSSADLRSADLRSADLRSANLSYADGLTPQQLTDALTDEWTRLPSGLVVPR